MGHAVRTITTLSALALGATVALAAPAAARSEQHTDTTRDVTVQRPEGATGGVRGAAATTDIHRVRVDHGVERVRFLLGVRRLDNSLDPDPELLIATPTDRFLVRETSYREAAFLAVYRLDDAGQETDQVCLPTETVLAEAIRIDVDRSCLDEPRWIRYGAAMLTSVIGGPSYADDMWLDGDASFDSRFLRLSDDPLRSGPRRS